MPITGTCVAKFNNAVPITLNGAWGVELSVPVFRAYGQGDGSPGSGYNGSSLGTAQGVSGDFEFVVDPGGIEAARLIQTGMFGFFTIDWPLGDPLAGASNLKAIDAHFDSLRFDVDNPQGRFTIRGRMSAGKVTGPGITQPVT